MHGLSLEHLYICQAEFQQPTTNDRIQILNEIDGALSILLSFGADEYLVTLTIPCEIRLDTIVSPGPNIEKKQFHLGRSN